jgi:hypothetical protein
MAGCHCLCSKLHPKEPGICTGVGVKAVAIVDKDGDRVGTGQLCQPCYAAGSRAATYAPKRKPA